ncbi:MAG: HepT-like ribonuclease domain-containing protein [Acetobacteraceae bacterium]
MAERSPIPHLTDIIEAIELIRIEMADVALDAFEGDRRQRWLIERGVEIISEASRRLPESLKARRAEVPWAKESAMSCATTAGMLPHP